MGALQNNESPANDHVESPRTLYRDDDIVVIDKPAGMHVFPLSNGEEAVLSFLIRQWPELAAIGDPKSPAIAHRLDQGTSGLLLVARTQNMYQALRTMFRRGAVHKTYLALVEGEISQYCAIGFPIGARHRRSQKVLVAARARDRQTVRSLQKAMTSIYPLGSAHDFSFCRVEIATGVRHQIRAHLSHIGHPIAGDTLYGSTQMLPEITGRFFLHAWRLDLAHPMSKKALSFVSPLPESLNSILDRFGIPLPPKG